MHNISVLPKLVIFIALNLNVSGQRLELPDSLFIGFIITFENLLHSNNLAAFLSADGRAIHNPTFRARALGLVPTHAECDLDLDGRRHSATCVYAQLPAMHLLTPA